MWNINVIKYTFVRYCRAWFNRAWVCLVLNAQWPVWLEYLANHGRSSGMCHPAAWQCHEKLTKFNKLASTTHILIIWRVICYLVCAHCMAKWWHLGLLSRTMVVHSSNAQYFTRITIVNIILHLLSEQSCYSQTDYALCKQWTAITYATQISPKKGLA